MKEDPSWQNHRICYNVNKVKESQSQLKVEISLDLVVIRRISIRTSSVLTHGLPAWNADSLFP